MSREYVDHPRDMLENARHAGHFTEGMSGDLPMLKETIE